MNIADEVSMVESNISNKFEVDPPNPPETLYANRLVKAKLTTTKSENGAEVLAPVSGGENSNRRPVRAHGRQNFDPLNVKYLNPNQLRANPRNARRHSKRQIRQLAAAIKKFGFLGVILIDATGMILAGHGRWMAATQLGLDVVPCMVVEHLDDAAQRAFIISDNRLGELSDWNYEVLKLELAELEELEIDFALSITGFDTPAFDRIIGPEKLIAGNHVDVDGFSNHPDDNVPLMARTQPATSRLGDIWILGEHRLLNGDALDETSYNVLMNGEEVGQVVSDPPYNVPVHNHVSGVGGFREFQNASGEMSPQEFKEFLKKAMRLAAKRCRKGAIMHICMDWRHIKELSEAAFEAGLEFKNLCIWVKPSAGMGSFYRSQHELVFVFKVGSAPHVNNFELGQHGRFRSNIWNYPAVRGVRTGVNDPVGGHPTVKPTSMMIDAILDCSNRGEIIFDPFGGSGTTLIAAQRCKRRARLIELDCHYCDLTIRRFEALTGTSATLAGDGRTFAEVAAERLSPIPSAIRTEDSSHAR